MKLLVNASLLRFGGAVQVALSFIHECRSYSENEYHVVLGPGVGAVLDRSKFPPNFKFYDRNFGVMKLRKIFQVQKEMSALESEIRPECVVTTSGPSYWRSKSPHLTGFNLPLYIYPESPYLKDMPLSSKLRLNARKWLHCRLLRRDADALIAQTEDVRVRAKALLGIDKSYTVTNNHGAWYEEPSESPARLPPSDADVFRFLTLTAFYPHKNLDLIPKVIEALPHSDRNRVEFVLTLTKNQYQKHISRNIPDQVRLVGSVPPPECPSLYKECDAMFLPTLAECFSASYPEAMRMGIPIITTNLGFAQSICENAALYFEPCDAQSAAVQIMRLVNDKNLRAALCDSGERRLMSFDTPAQRARKILDICRDLAAQSTDQVAA